MKVLLVAVLLQFHAATIFCQLVYPLPTTRQQQCIHRLAAQRFLRIVDKCESHDLSSVIKGNWHAKIKLVTIISFSAKYIIMAAY